VVTGLAYLCFPLKEGSTKIGVSLLKNQSKHRMNMMTAAEIRKKYLDFFASKKHQIVASAPIVVKNDPTYCLLMQG
jgi:hypothetical protein